MARTAKLHQLTDAAVKAYANRPGTHTPLHDGGGLYLRKRESAAYWYLRLSDPHTGAEQWHRLFPDDVAGAYPHKGLKAARAEAAVLWATRAEGIDPRAARVAAIERSKSEAQAAKQEKARQVSMRDLFDRWASTELQPRTRADGRRTGRKDGGAYVRQQFERHVFPTLGETTITDVRKADVLTQLDAQASAGKLRTANMLLADLKQMFRFALARELIDRNPLDTVTKRDVGGASVERERVLIEDELKALVAALPNARMSPRSECAIWLTLATGCRVGELTGATWSDVKADRAKLAEIADASDVKLGSVDLRAGTWHMPDTKNQREHTIHLSAFALRYFKHLATMRPVDDNHKPVPWIFPAADMARPVCVKSLSKQLADRQRPPDKRMKNRSNATEALCLPGGKWTAHDLRRTTGTLMARLGVSTDVINECLNHMQQDRMARVYIRDRREADQARAFDALGAYLEKLAGSNPAMSSETSGVARQPCIAPGTEAT